ncbi:MAG: hypothetical protein KKF46_04420 [Nanoarchaeota archaeon]|nr:hypothetical protein [Nanoarchaeota archaeon]MBU1321581.1 hypothetical protein [Nanoarchaeota archaeon]MBU1598374.1 hypothetical protein [Nanoarchaeota archaeon]
MSDIKPLVDVALGFGAYFGATLVTVGTFFCGLAPIITAPIQYGRDRRENLTDISLPRYMFKITDRMIDIDLHVYHQRTINLSQFYGCTGLDSKKINVGKAQNLIKLTSDYSRLNKFMMESPIESTDWKNYVNEMMSSRNKNVAFSHIQTLDSLDKKMNAYEAKRMNDYSVSLEHLEHNVDHIIGNDFFSEAKEPLIDFVNSININPNVHDALENLLKNEKTIEYLKKQRRFENSEKLFSDPSGWMQWLGKR